jgi:hypothetical protein
VQGTEIARAIGQFTEGFVSRYNPSAFQLKTLDALAKCRTQALGGHWYECDCCHKRKKSYNSCRNRHCPKCQSARQAFWVEDRINQAYAVKHFHLVFTLPHQLNEICLLDNRWFYNLMFDCASQSIRTLGYSHYGVECGIISVLHTWGQNLDFHPHLHCLVPALGQTLAGNIKPIGHKGKYLFPDTMLAMVFKGKIMQGVKQWLCEKGLLQSYQRLVDELYAKRWVLKTQASFASARHVVGYLGQYIHRVAITNERIVAIDQNKVTFRLKDYRNGGRPDVISLDGVEFIRRFVMHILPYRFVRIRYFGIYHVKMQDTLQQDAKMKIVIAETIPQRIKRLTGIDVIKCPFCKKG